VPTVMIQGCSSWAGKSLVTTALARLFTRRGLRVAPFKALNMANNARVADGGEMATAQYLQALAAGIQPDVRMNPVLVKPEADMRSQVVVLGKVDHDLSRTAWRGRAAALWPHIEAAFGSLERDVDLVVAEGAGSPAEFNLWDVDVANMRVAEMANAAVLLVADIDRGGAFAHLWGTWSLLPPRQRSLIKGFVLNKFRGDRSLLDPAPDELERMTGVPVIGVIPYIEHGLPDEDGAGPVRRTPRADASVVAVIRYPTASNLDEFKPLEDIATLRWARSAQDLDGADLVVLPGSKFVAWDLDWLRQRGFDDALRGRIERGQRVLGICGGLQMLGERIEDPADVDGTAGALSLLPLSTRFESEKITRETHARFGTLPEPWSELSGLEFDGYEIRHGQSRHAAGLQEAILGGLGFVQGSLLVTYIHGLFETPTVTHALFGDHEAPSLDETFDRLADAVERAFDVEPLDTIVLKAMRDVSAAAETLRRPSG
jgi:adenosylcobyric acid synthase